MNKILKIMKGLVALLVVVYVAVCTLLYVYQEKIIFLNTSLPEAHQYSFPFGFQEYSIQTEDDIALNGVLVPSEESKGIVLFLHGNAGNVNHWAYAAENYIREGYDFFVFDYRGYGKSKGNIYSSKQLLEDNQQVYDFLKTLYDEKDIVVVGYSIGSGMAAHLALNNDPRHLVLLSPYYSIREQMKENYSWVPSFLLRYNFETGEYLKKSSTPLTVFHGLDDELIPVSHSYRLEKEVGEEADFIYIDGQGHQGIGDHPVYRSYWSEFSP